MDIEPAKVIVLDIDVPEYVKENARKGNGSSNPLVEENDDVIPCSRCGDFKGAFGEYLISMLCSDSPYVGVKVKVKVGNSEPVWLRMDTRGPPYGLIPAYRKISSSKGLIFPEL